MIRRLLFWMVGLIIVALAGYVYMQVRKGKIQQVEVIQAVPTDAALLLNINDLADLYSEELNKSRIWQEILLLNGMEPFQAALQEIDSLLSSEKELLAHYRSARISLSFHRSGKTGLEFILYHVPGNNGADKLLERFLFEHASPISERKYNEIKVFDAENFSFTFTHGLFILSRSSILLEEAIRQLGQEKSLVDEPGFKVVAATAGSNVYGNVFLDYQSIPSYISQLFNQRYQEQVAGFTRFTNWAEMDIHVRHDAVLLNGFTQAQGESGEFLEIITKHAPQRMDIEHAVPANVAAFLALGLEDFTRFKKDYIHYLEINGIGRSYLRALESLKAEYQVDPESLLLPVVEQQAAVVITDVRNAGWDENCYVVCQTRSQSLAEEKIKELLEAVCQAEDIALSSLILQSKVSNDLEYTFYRLPVSFLPAKLFGRIFEGINSKYCVFHDNYLVFGNSVDALSRYIHALQLGNNLSSDLDFHRFSEYLATRSNLYLFLNIPGALQLKSRYFHEDLARKIESNEDVLSGFQGVAYQVTSEDELAYHNIIFKYAQVRQEDAQTVWESRLDHPVVTKPKLVTNHYTGEQEIFVQDQGHQIYLINGAGRILWKKKLEEEILSEVYQIDFYQNGKLQLLFNTKNRLYLLDRNGNNVENYPIVLRSPASNGLALFDYERNRNYRLAIAGEDRKLYMYDKEGNVVRGWNQKQTEGTVHMPLQHFRVGDRDYLVCADHFNTYILNRRGETRVRVQKHFPVPVQAKFILESQTTGVKPRLVTTDTLGRVHFIYFDGTVETRDLGTWSGAHYFDYSDLDGDGKREFILVDGNALHVFHLSGNKKFSRNFKADISHPPVIYQFSQGNKKIGLVSGNRNELFLVNNDGNMYKGFPLLGSTRFSIGRISKTGSQFNLIVGSDQNFLYNYSLQ